jgi:signal transduction histidine kinase
MSINDDGKGFDTNTVTHRNGIKNIHNRIEKWKGKVSVKSMYGKGTMTEVSIPLS